MSRWEEIHDILVQAGIDHVDFTALTEEERLQIESHVANFIGRMYAREDAVINLDGKNLRERPEVILYKLQQFADTQYQDEMASEVGMARSFYHEIQMQLARIEGATGLELTGPEGFSNAYNSYWETTLMVFRQLQMIEGIERPDGEEGA